MSFIFYIAKVENIHGCNVSCVSASDLIYTGIYILILHCRYECKSCSFYQRQTQNVETTKECKNNLTNYSRVELEGKLLGHLVNY